MKTTKPKWYYWWLIAWADMFAGMVSVLTIGKYRPEWDMNVSLWLSKKAVKRRAK